MTPSDFMALLPDDLDGTGVPTMRDVLRSMKSDDRKAFLAACKEHDEELFEVLWDNYHVLRHPDSCGWPAPVAANLLSVYVVGLRKVNTVLCTLDGRILLEIPLPGRRTPWLLTPVEFHFYLNCSVEQYVHEVMLPRSADMSDAVAVLSRLPVQVRVQLASAAGVETRDIVAFSGHQVEEWARKNGKTVLELEPMGGVSLPAI